ncbi:hypothetical protein [Sinomicrobium soli]|uniref:hypothetical protein n=1 Tax=Sinomicrobium sp. N-1-3-6 TaxID=2219864 RepID=UPI000DCCC943|nr:hypothetical protein [Sinomicrobium sp. N-1-3-6]RAV29396.1 hypothetical protein DN748_07775 [Sinomicrobium sp. N-1-3-6]
MSYQNYFSLITAFLLLWAGACKDGAARRGATHEDDTFRKDLRAEKGDTLDLVFENGKAHISIFKEERQKKYLRFTTATPGTLTAEITAGDSGANLRFGQILMPDGTADGPFGKTIEYHLPHAGTYLLWIGENQMAGDPWEGVFEVNAVSGK